MTIFQRQRFRSGRGFVILAAAGAWFWKDTGGISALAIAATWPAVAYWARTYLFGVVLVLFCAFCFLRSNDCPVNNNYKKEGQIKTTSHIESHEYSNGPKHVLDKLFTSNTIDMNTRALTYNETPGFSALMSPRIETLKPSYIPLRKMETAHVDCGRILRGDVGYTTSVTRNRPFLLSRTESYDCDTVRKRVLPSVPLMKLEFGIAYARIVYRDYEFIEDELRSSFHPQNYFCYSIDKKADRVFQWNIENLAKCFPNIIVIEKFNIDEYGHFMNHAHHECMQHLRQKHGWEYLILLQNHDVIIKSQYEMVEIYKLLGGANDVEITPCPKDRLSDHVRWDALSLELFKKPWEIPYKQLNAKLSFAKGAVQASLSRAAVEWMVDVANLTTFINQLNEKPFGIDEILIQSLQATDDLEMPGRFTSDCLNRGRSTSSITRMSIWTYDGVNQCRSNFVRKSICILGIEDLASLSQYRHIMANKMLPEFDYSIVECVHEMIFNRTFLGQIDQPLDVNYYTNMSNVKYNMNRKHPNPNYRLDCN